MEEFYPMPLFIALEVNDIPASVAWYRSALGFRVVFEARPTSAGTPSLVHFWRRKLLPNGRRTVLPFT